MTKICGECKFFVQSEYLDVCTVHSEPQSHNRKCDLCEYFEPKIITNGDKIRQMGNSELVDLLGCDCCSGHKYDWCNHIDCKQGKLAWLNAPAESENNNE